MALATGTSGRGAGAAKDAAEAWALFLRLFEAERPRLMALYRDSGLTPPQLMTLRRLAGEEPQPMSEVARVLACDASNVTGIVDRLEERGLLRRRPSPQDRRVTMLELTPDGAAVAAELDARMGEPPAALLSLSRSDQRAIRDLLRRALGESG